MRFLEVWFIPHVRGGILQKIETGDRVRFVIRFPGPGRLVDAGEVRVGRVSGFITRGGAVVERSSRSVTCAIIEEDGRGICLVPGRDRLLGVLGRDGNA